MRKVFLIVLLASMVLIAKTVKAEDAGKVVVLVEVDKLRLDGLKKDAIIANQQLSMAKHQFDDATTEDKERTARFWSAVEALREKVNAPESEYDFDIASLSFKLKSRKFAQPIPAEVPAKK